jgi:hypothetical protein
VITEQENAEHRRPKSVIIGTSPSLPNRIRSPMIRHKRIYHHLPTTGQLKRPSGPPPVIGVGELVGGYSHGNKGEDGGANPACAIGVEVEETNGQAAEDDGELQP